MKAYTVQLDIAWEDKKANYRKVSALLQEAGVAAGSLIVLPEMFATGFSMNLGATREGSPSETEAYLRGLAQAHASFVLGGVVNVNADARAYNQAVVFSPEGQLLCRYSKIHPFTLGGEAACYTAGSELVSFNWRGMTVAPFICYDLRFPEVFRAAVGRGAQLFAVIANWPVKREQHWMTLLQARAIENQVWIVAAAQWGKHNEKRESYGHSLIVDPWGTIVGERAEGDGVVVHALSGAEVDKRRAQMPCGRHAVLWKR